MKDNFKFYVPVSLQKSKEGKGSDAVEMLLEGLAGDGSSDSEGENLTYKGFDLSRMYYINWEHSKEPEDVIGVILQKQLQKGGKLYIKGKLFNGHKKARDAYQLQKFLEEENEGLGFSVEGKVISRDPINPKVVTKAEIYGVALCKVPVNPMTYARISKAFSTGEDLVDEEENEEVEKMTTADIAPSMPESVEKKKKNEEKDISLTKSQIYSRIFNSFTSDPLLADSIYLNLIKPIARMENGQIITEESIKKAQEILGLATSNSASKEEINKSVDMNVQGEENGGEIAVLKKAMKDSKKDYLEKAKAYSEMCKAKGEDFEDDDDEEEAELKKGISLSPIQGSTTPFNAEILKSVISEVLGGVSGSIDNIEKSFMTRTTALGTLFNSQSEKINSLNEQLEKANSTIEKLDEYNQDFRTRLGVVERTPIRKSVTTENFKERFQEENKEDVPTSGRFNINSKADRERLEKSVDAIYGNDLTNPENYAIMEAISTLQMTGTVMEGQQALLKSKGYELVMM